MAAVFIDHRDSFAGILVRACIHALTWIFLSIYHSCFFSPCAVSWTWDLQHARRMFYQWVLPQPWDFFFFFTFESGSHISQSCFKLTVRRWPWLSDPLLSSQWRLQTWTTRCSLHSTRECHPGLPTCWTNTHQLSSIHSLKQDLAKLPRQALNL